MGSILLLGITDRTPPHFAQESKRLMFGNVGFMYCEIRKTGQKDGNYKKGSYSVQHVFLHSF